jgi:hypothetical protein
MVHKKKIKEKTYRTRQILDYIEQRPIFIGNQVQFVSIPHYRNIKEEE